MTAKNARALGVVILLFAIFTVLSLVELTVDIARAAALGSLHGAQVGSDPLLSAAVWTTRALLIWAAYRFSRVARHGAPTYLFAAVIVTTVANVALGYALRPGVASSLLTITLSGAGQLLLCAGLVFSGWVSSWIPWLGAIASLAESGSLLYVTLRWPVLVSSQIQGLGQLAYLLFLFSLGVALILRSRTKASPRPPSAPVETDSIAVP